MEGLEISIFTYKDICTDNEEFRIDSEYYKKEYINIYKYIDGSPKLSELVFMSDVTTNGSFKTIHDILNDNNVPKIPYIRSGNVGDTFINTQDLILISQEAHTKLPRSTTK